MRWKELLQIYEPELRAAFPGDTIFSTKTDDGKTRWDDLKKRVVEHVSRPSLVKSGSGRAGKGLTLIWWRVYMYVACVNVTYMRTWCCCCDRRIGALVRQTKRFSHRSWLAQQCWMAGMFKFALICTLLDVQCVYLFV